VKTLLLRSLCIAGALGFAASAGSAKPIQEKRPVDEDVLVTVKNVNGTVTIEGWNEKQLEVTGTLSGDIEDVEISGSSSRMTIEVQFPRHTRHSSGEADLDIKVPVGAGVRVEVVNCPISISKLRGDLELEAVNGDIAIAGEPARIEAQTVNGKIEIDASCAHVDAQTVGGRIVIRGAQGDLTAATVGGRIQVTGGKFERVRLSSVSGTIDFGGELAGKATFEGESHAGDIVLHLPDGVSADFDVSTFSGDIDNDFGPTGARREYGPGRELTFSTGDGDARVRLSTFSGDVQLTKKAQAESER